MAGKIKLMILAIVSTFHVIGSEQTQTSSNHISAFEPIFIATQYVKYSGDTNQILIKDVGFGPFGANAVVINIKNVPGTVRGTLNLRLDGANRDVMSPPISVPTNANSPSNVSALLTPNRGLHDLYISLPNGLSPANIVYIVFSLIETPKTGRWYFILNDHSGKALSVDKDSRMGYLVQRTYAGGANQQFRFEEYKSGKYKIIIKNSGLVLQKIKSRVQVADFQKFDDQLWRLKPYSDGTVRLFDAYSEYCLKIWETNNTAVNLDYAISGNDAIESWWVIPC